MKLLHWTENWYSEADMRRWDYGCYSPDRFPVEVRGGVAGRLVRERVCINCDAVVQSPLGGIMLPNAPPHECKRAAP